MTRIVAVLLLLAILPTACGSDSDDNADSATAATRLCRDLERELATVDPPREIEEPDELAAFVRGTATSVGAWIERMRELEPDAADAEQVASMLDRYTEAVILVEEAAAALERGKERRYQELVREAERPSMRGDRIARELDVETCAYPLSG